MSGTPPEVERPEVRNAGDLFTQCRRQFDLTPEDVLGLAGFDSADDLQPGDYLASFESIQAILILRSGQLLRPEKGRADLAEAVEDAERKAWKALAQYRFQEFGHWAGVWSTLAEISQERWTNPFGQAASLGKAKLRRR